MPALAFCLSIQAAMRCTGLPALSPDDSARMKPARRRRRVSSRRPANDRLQRLAPSRVLMNSVAIWSVVGAAAAQDALTTKLKAVTTALAQVCYGAAPIERDRFTLLR